MDQLGADRERFLALVREWHAGHPRADQVQHCANVANQLERALDLEPAPVAARRDMILAALGHDLYEDSHVPPASVMEFGEEVHGLIQHLTEGTAGVAAYVERMASAPEEARLIKFCDGIDNYSGLVENKLIESDPAKWVKVVREHMEPMFNRISSIPFHKYAAAGAWLSSLLAERRERFWKEVERLPLARTEVTQATTPSGDEMR